MPGILAYRRKLREYKIGCQREFFEFIFLYGRSDARTVSGLLITHVQLAQAEIAERNVAGIIKQDIFRLQIAASINARHTSPSATCPEKAEGQVGKQGGHIPIHDIESMQMFECTEQFRRIEPCAFLIKPTLTLEVMEKFTSVNKREDEVKFFGRLERKLERDDEWVVDLREHRSFRQRVRHLRPGDDVRLANRLERVDTRCVPLPHLHDLMMRRRHGRMSGLHDRARNSLKYSSRTLPKLPLPMTLSKSKASIFNDVPWSALYETWM